VFILKKIAIFIFSLILILLCTVTGCIANNEKRENRIARIYKEVPMDSTHIMYVIDLAYEYDIDPDLILAIIWTESNFDPNAKNKTSSASGYSQMIKSTALNCVKSIGSIKDYDHKVHSMDPYINLRLMAYYINRCLYNSGGNIDKALISYRGCNSVNYNRLIKNRMNIIKNNKVKG